MTVDYRTGDSIDVVATIPDGSVSLVATSPPFIALRSYLPDDHPDKQREIGSEPNPGAFLNRLLGLTAEWGRVLAPWGSIAVELGDTFAGSGGAGGDYSEGGLRDGQNAFVGSSARDRRVDTKRTRVSDGSGAHPIRDLHGKKSGGGTGWPRAKCLALIPQAYALSLAYGINVLTGQPSPAGQWLVRNVIVWHRPNPAVGALGDKVRPSTSYITVATRSAKRWFDLDAVRMPFTGHAGVGTGVRKGQGGAQSHDNRPDDLPTRFNTHEGAPPLDCWFDEHDVWTLTTQPSQLAHYAMWPAKLAERLVLMMCPAEVCSTCGEPRRRLTGPAEYVNRDGTPRTVLDETWRHGRVGLVGDPLQKNTMTAKRPTLGWSDCGCGAAHEWKQIAPGAMRCTHCRLRDADPNAAGACGHRRDDYRPGIVLDPFCGSGTTMAAAEFHGRDAIGIDLDSRNREMWPARREEVFRALNPTHVRTAEGQAQLELLL